MTAITDFSQQSEFALAAYAQLSSGIAGALYRKALEDAGMSTAQADDFAKRWTVIDSASFLNGAAATIFEEVGKPGVRYLATHGNKLRIDIHRKPCG